jgi:hypothetical protein
MRDTLKGTRGGVSKAYPLHIAAVFEISPEGFFEDCLLTYSNV